MSVSELVRNDVTDAEAGVAPKNGAAASATASILTSERRLMAFPSRVYVQNPARLSVRSRERSSRGAPRMRALALLAQLVEHLHGKEGVDGSSPSEGSKIPAKRGFLLSGLVHKSTSLTRRVSAVDGASAGRRFGLNSVDPGRRAATRSSDPFLGTGSGDTLTRRVATFGNATTITRPLALAPTPSTDAPHRPSTRGT